MGNSLRTSYTLLGVILLTSCGGGSSSPPPLPANATPVDSSNAVDLALIALNSVLPVSEFRLKSESSNRDAVDLPNVRQILHDWPALSEPQISLATGVVRTFSGDCALGGTFTSNYSEDFIGNSYIRNGTDHKENCNERGEVVSGTISYTYTENLLDDNYNNNLSGNFQMTFDDGAFSWMARYSNLVHQETGNLFAGSYTVSTHNYALEVISPTVLLGIVISLDAPIVETSGDRCPESGVIRVDGANGTSVLGEFAGRDANVVFKGAVIQTLSCF